MESFLTEVARKLYDDYGDGISGLRILFPNRRSQLFFNEALAEIAKKPLWQPAYTSVDEIMEKISGLAKADPIRTVTELYKVYSQFHAESFDSFYAWGEILLSDFDSIDKYMIDAKTLFINIADLKSLENDLSFLTPEQIKAIRKFWRNFNPEDLSSPEKRRFAGIWNTLNDIYTIFRENLIKMGIGYQGLIYRTAAEKMKAVDFDADGLDGQYAIIGFNALSECEKMLFDVLQRSKKALFLWDYDDYYTGNKHHEAGMFIRGNISRYIDASPYSNHDHFAGHKEIVSVAAPSDAMQAKYVAEFLERLVKDGKIPAKETAIVLTDENLLTPVLFSIPEEITDINVTMGYPLKLTPAYTLLERLIALQLHKKTSKRDAMFYHSDIKGILHHPYIQAADANAAALAAEITKKQQVYIPAGTLNDGTHGLLPAIFTPMAGWESLSAYFIGIFTLLDRLTAGFQDGLQREFFMLLTDNIYKLENSLRESGQEVTDGVFLSLLRKALQKITIPYEGEPLKGVQVMGILETRNLDFENILILSMNDETFPGDLSSSSSFVPFNLRLAYGLPTPQHHEGVYGYYFYRLIQRAKRIHLVYSSKADEKRTGEPSRYIYQLDYESHHDIAHRNIVLNVNAAEELYPEVVKSGKVGEELAKFLGDNASRVLSPSAFYTYVECPMKFYFRYIANIREQEEAAEEVDMPMFGNIFHKAAETIYSTLKGRPNPEEELRRIRNDKKALEKIVDEAIKSEFLKDSGHSAAEEFGGNISLVRDIVCKYLGKCLLEYDVSHPGFIVSDTECWVEYFISFGHNGNTAKVKFGGKIDRMDTITADGSVRIIDYKTGMPKVEFKGVDSLFSDKFSDRNPAALQTLLYSLLVNAKTGYEVVPSLYYLRHMNDREYSPLLKEVAAEGGKSVRLAVTRFTDYKEDVGRKLKDTLSEIFDTGIPFRRCEDQKTCEYCPLITLCK